MGSAKALRSGYWSQGPEGELTGRDSEESRFCHHCNGKPSEGVRPEVGVICFYTLQRRYFGCCEENGREGGENGSGSGIWPGSH